MQLRGASLDGRRTMYKSRTLEGSVFQCSCRRQLDHRRAMDDRGHAARPAASAATGRALRTSLPGHNAHRMSEESESQVVQPESRCVQNGVGAPDVRHVCMVRSRAWQYDGALTERSPTGRRLGNTRLFGAQFSESCIVQR